MAIIFKKCPKGHYYQGDFCEWCHPEKRQKNASNKTQIIFSDNSSNKSNNSVFPVPASTPAQPKGNAIGRTQFVNEESPDKVRDRRLVGWLVSYTLDEMGVDFRLYEGRNLIGRDPKCDIVIDDNMVSGTHALLLFRDGRYSLTDQQSTHGTKVLGEDIELAPRYLEDGDVIAIGKTELIFRTSF